MAEHDGEDLGRAPIAYERAQQVIARVQNSRESATFALVGEWGSGKTWLLEALLRNLESNDNWISTRCEVVHFNPWYYADEQALFAGFASLLVQGTLKKGRTRARLAGLLKMVGPSAKFGTIDLTAVVNHAGKALESTSPSQIRKEIAKGLAHSGQQLLIVMDDIDRLNPDELLILFKLVRLVGEVAGLHYLLAYDEDTLHHLLTQTAIAGRSPERARRYVEKIVERRWEVPPLTDSQLDEILFAKLPLKDGDPSDPGVGYRLESLIRSAITTPRAVARYIDLASSIPKRARDELHQRDLHLTIFLRVAAPALLKEIVQERQFLVGGGPYLIERELKAHAERVLHRFRAVIKDLAFGEDLLSLIIDSFPRLAHACDARNMKEADAPRIGHSDFIDHYLWLDLPPGSISEVALTAALRRLPDEVAEREIRNFLLASPRLTLDSLSRNSGAEGISRVQVFRLLERLYSTHGVTITLGVFATPVDKRIFAIANDLLKKMSETDFRELAVESGWAGRRLLVELVARLHARPESGADILNNFVTEIAIPIARPLRDRLENAESPAFPERLAREDLHLLLELDPDSARSLIRRRLNAFAWREDDIASLYVVIQLSEADSYRWQLNVRGMRADLGDELADRIEGAVCKADEDGAAKEILMQVPAGERMPTIEEGRLLTRYLFAEHLEQRDHIGGEPLEGDQSKG